MRPLVRTLLLLTFSLSASLSKAAPAPVELLDDGYGFDYKGTYWEGDTIAIYMGFFNEVNEIEIDTHIPFANVSGAGVAFLGGWNGTVLEDSQDGSAVVRFEANGSNAQNGDVGHFYITTTGLAPLETYDAVEAEWGVYGPAFGIYESDVSNSNFNPAFAEPLFTPNAMPSNVPVPAAAWLFGSALIGLVGIKRNK